MNFSTLRRQVDRLEKAKFASQWLLDRGEQSASAIGAWAPKVSVAFQMGASDKGCLEANEAVSTLIARDMSAIIRKTFAYLHDEIEDATQLILHEIEADTFAKASSSFDANLAKLDETLASIKEEPIISANRSDTERAVS